MIIFPLALVLTAAQAPQGPDEIQALARSGPDSVLVQRARERPDDARRALRRLLAVSGGEDSASLAALTAADRIAAAVALAWQDSFLVRQVTRFRSLSPPRRLATVAADSAHRVGLAALQSAGIDSAMGACRESLRRYEALGDTAGVAKVVGNLAAIFFHAQEYDSAEVYLTRSKDLAERIGDYQTLANALGNLGALSERRGDRRRASEFLERAKPIRERIGDVGGLAGDQSNLGTIALRLGDLAGARRAFDVALAAARNVDDAELAAIVLSNLGQTAALEGQYADAEGRYREALLTYRERGNQVQGAVVLVDLGRLAMGRGDYPAAVTALSDAARILRRIGVGAVTSEVDEIDVRWQLAHARAGMGDLQGARTELERAEGLATRQGGARGRVSLAKLAVGRGDLAVEFNRLAEAERAYARAQRLARNTPDDWVGDEAARGMADVLFKRESYHRAEVVLKQLLLRPYADRASRALLRLLIGRAAWLRGDTGAARLAIGQALDTLHALGAAEGEAQALAALADIEAKASHALVAESLYRRALNRVGMQQGARLTWQLHAGLARVLRARGALPRAVQELESSIAEIERVSAGLALEEHRAAFQADKWDVYVDLALVEWARGRTEAAFEASERLRARQMLDLLARGRVAESDTTRRLAGREQDLRRTMAALAQRLADPSDTGQGEADALRDPIAAEAAADATRGAFARAQEEYSELMLEMREANPAYAALVRAETAPPRMVRAALASNEALIEYLVGDSTTLVFVVTSDTLAVLNLNVSHDAIVALVAFARGTLTSPKEGALRQAWRPSLRRLYQRLVAPLVATGLLSGKRRLLIAPHAELHYLPFAALVVPGEPELLLVDRYVLEYVPSASVWLRLRERPTAVSGGVLALAPRATALPGSQMEVAAIRRTYGDRARTLVGPPATEAAFRALAPGQEIVHLATYGVLNKRNPLFSFVELGAGDGHDGRLEVHEVFGLTLIARLVVLSACQTGIGAGALADVPPGDDWVGLVQGFLYAGASNVLGTLWPVADVATARLMENFYRELAAGRPEAEALALAQQVAARDPRTSHPFHWAGFALVRGQ